MHAMIISIHGASFFFTLDNRLILAIYFTDISNVIMKKIMIIIIHGASFFYTLDNQLQSNSY